jgi:predicted nucleic acid-binding protein
VVSFAFKGHPLSASYRNYLAKKDCAVSFMTIAELYEGGYRAGWNDARWNALRLMLDDFVILQSDAEITEAWAWIRSERRLKPIAGDDAWIAATALVYDCPLVTHNPADFDGIRGLRVLSAIR